ncbi:LppX_LprAFG lipoprotein [Arsenicicoccus sp. oral taxon 190]|uniref:LppX_LprAFG lipoprotein n=1 Tax=Arsenicicoccus sp. oral taxon 190 TaxID=1658671 RepID=UPI00067A385C|nr:LppX_LprAFG lipoprotein [Arsenicicoccus sp. oral taxon 190]AKT52512.1 hypothetical protein ADJ73_01830 [Arsenicicoccus sp. oral taxon 190]
MTVSTGARGRPTRTSAAALLTAVAVVTAGGCSGGEDQRPEPTAADRLAAAKRQLDTSSSVRVAISSPDFPSGAQGVSAAEGVATHQPAFQGTLTVRARGLSGTVDVVSVDRKLHLRLPFTPRFVQADPAQYGAPDPAQLLSPDRGISSLLTATRSPQLGAKQRDGTAVLQTVTGTIPGGAVADVLATGDRQGSFAATYTIADDDRLRSVQLKGPFFAGSQSTYDVRLDGYGEPVTVRAP